MVSLFLVVVRWREMLVPTNIPALRLTGLCNAHLKEYDGIDKTVDLKCIPVDSQLLSKFMAPGGKISSPMDEADG